MSQSTRRRAGLAIGSAALAAMAALPHAAADPAPAPTPAAQFATDEHGYLDSAARCDDSQMLMEYGRTARALVAICVGADGQLEYRGARIEDQAALTMPASKGADGAVIATNDDVTYAVTTELLLVSQGDTVLHRDPWIDFHQPRSPNTPSTSAAAPTPATTATAAPPTTTVSTTTVTPTPSTAKKAG